MINETIKKLESKIKFHRMLYYNGTPIVSDDVYDLLIEQLEKVFPDSVVLKKEVGANFTEEHFLKRRHIIPMGSLNKVNTPDSYLEWSSKFSKNTVKILQEKLDGFSMELVYRKGILISAITRGHDGIEGEDIIRNVIKMKNVKIKLPFKIDCSLRAEIIVPKDTFKIHFSDMSNERNTANGVAKRLDGKGSEHLMLLYYNILLKNGFDSELRKELHSYVNDILLTRKIEIKNGKFLSFDNNDFENEMAKITFIQEYLQLNCVSTYICETDSDIISLWENYKVKREGMNHLIDGLVIKINDINIQQKFDDKDDLKPKSQIAFKFANEAEVTTLLKVKWLVGRTGVITPLAELKPVEVQGRIFSRATLCNCDEIERLNIGIGDKVIVESCGDVIPKITEVIESFTKNVVQIPTQCPICNGATVRIGPRLMCLNDDCKEKKIRKIIYWIHSAEIEEIGHETVRQLYEKCLIKDAADLYTLDLSIANLDRKGDKSAKKIIENIQNSKSMDIITFLTSLGIDLLAKKTVKRIIQKYDSNLDTILNLTINDLIKVDGISTKKAESIVTGLIKESFLIKKLLLNGIMLKTVDNKISNKGSFCITGSCELINNTTDKRFTRKELEDIIINNGGEIASVNKDLKYLIVFDKPGSKLEKAKKLGITILDQTKFMKMFNLCVQD